MERITFGVKIYVLGVCRLTAMGKLQANHHSMVGSTKDPADGKAVAGSIFTAVIVYAVETLLHFPAPALYPPPSFLQTLEIRMLMMMHFTGFLGLLRHAGLLTCAAK